MVNRVFVFATSDSNVARDNNSLMNRVFDRFERCGCRSLRSLRFLISCI